MFKDTGIKKEDGGEGTYDSRGNSDIDVSVDYEYYNYVSKVLY